MKTVYFDNISLIHRPIIFLFLKLRYKIKIFNFNHDLKKNKWLVDYINNKKIETIIPLEVNDFHGEAIDKAQNIEDTKFSKITKIYNSILDHNNTKIILKKEFARLFLEFYTVKNLVKKGSFLFQSKFEITKKNVEKIFNIKTKVDFKVIKSSNITSSIEYVIGLTKWKFIAFFYFLIKILTLIILNLFGRKFKKKKFQHVIPLDQEFQLKFKGKRSFDFFIDNKKFKMKNTLFLINFNVEKKWINKKKRQGYNFYEITEKANLKNSFLFSQSNEYLTNALIALIKNFLILKSTHLEKKFYQCLNTYINFSPIFNFFNFKNYIYTNQDSISQNVKNSMLKRENIKSWNYSSFIGGALLTSRSRKNFKEKRDILWSFQNSDNFIAVNEDVVKYLKLHYQDTRNYHVTGSLYSQFVKEYKKDYSKEELLNKINPDLDVSRYKKIISFFDTTFINNDNCLTSYKDGMKFCDNILKLSNEFKQIYFIFKNSKNKKFYTDKYSEWAIPKNGEELVKKWIKLGKSPNVFFAGDNSDPSLIMSISDSVYTHCLSSTWLEALDSGTLSYWYESRNKFSQSMYSKFIINGIDELRSNIEKILKNKNKLLKVQKQNVLQIWENYNFNNNSLDKIRKIIS